MAPKRNRNRASNAARRRAAPRAFKPSTVKKPALAGRIFVSLNSFPRGEPVALEDLVNDVLEQATLAKTPVPMRYETSLHTIIHGMAHTGLITFERRVVDGDIDRAQGATSIYATDNFYELADNAREMFISLVDQSLSFEELYKAECNSFHKEIKTALYKFTRKQEQLLAQHLFQDILDRDEEIVSLKATLPGEQDPAPPEFNYQLSNNGMSQVASPSTSHLRTPPRAAGSWSLNNPAAYPSPQTSPPDPPRRSQSRSLTPISPSLSSRRRNKIPSPPGGFDTDDDEQMEDVDDSPRRLPSLDQRTLLGEGTSSTSGSSLTRREAPNDSSESTDLISYNKLKTEFQVIMQENVVLKGILTTAVETLRPHLGLDPVTNLFMRLKDISFPLALESLQEWRTKQLEKMSLF